MKINYVNIKNETIAENLKLCFEHTPPKKSLINSKTYIENFLTKVHTINTVVYSYNKEFRNRIIFDDNNFQIGEVSEDLTFNIEIYNNSEELKTLEEINIINLSGINVEVDSLTINPFSSIYLSVTINVSGEADNDGSLQLIINSEIYYITINYSRKSIFSYMIDRSNDLTATYAYNTEIKTAKSGKEYREAKLDVSRLFIDYQYKLVDSERRKFENDIINNNLRSLYLPIYFDRVNSTVDHLLLRIYGDFKYTNIKAGNSVYAYSKKIQQILDVVSVNEEYIVVEKISDKFEGLFFVYPLVRTKISITASSSQVTKNFSRYLITFDIDEYETDDTLEINKTFTYETLDDKYFFKSLRRNFGEETKSFTKKVTILDNNISVRKTFIENSNSREQKTFTKKLFGKEEISEMKDIFKKCKGMKEDFYILKDDNSLKLVENINMSDIIVRVEDNNILNTFNGFFFDYVYIVFNNQDTLILKVNEVRKDENNREVLLIEPSSKSVNKDSVIFMSFICKARFNTDTLSITYRTDNVAEVSIDLITINRD